jgi:hypothetical protein
MRQIRSKNDSQSEHSGHYCNGDLYIELSSRTGEWPGKSPILRSARIGDVKVLPAANSCLWPSGDISPGSSFNHFW